METSRAERTESLRSSLAYVLVPIILFYPSVAALTICPPAWGPSVMGTLAVAFIASEGLGLRHLSRSVNWKFDGRFDGFSATAMGLMIVATRVIVICLYILFARPPEV